MKQSELRQLIREEISKIVNEERAVWASSEYEEIDTKVYDLFQLLSVLPQSSRVNKIKAALEDLNRLNREEQTQYR
jgi:hypothetical protein